MNQEFQSLFNPYIIESFYIHKNNVPYPVGTHFENRVVRFYELELITGGSGKIITEGKSVTVQKGDVFLRIPGMKVEGYSGYYFIVVAFDTIYNKSNSNLYNTTAPYWVQNEAGMLPNNSMFSNLPHKISTLNYSQTEGLFLNIFDEFTKNNQQNQLIMKSYLIAAINAFLSEYEILKTTVKTRSLQNNYDLIKSSVTYINENLDRDFSLGSLAEMCGLSRNFYCRIFKQIIGQPAFEYIIQSRINLAKKLLVTTNLSILDISIKCGIRDITYFYRLFKKHLNTTPVNFRNRYSYRKG